MKIKKGLDISTSEFYYDLTNGYLNPKDICENKKDVEEIIKAIETIEEFENSCESQIEGFLQ